MNSQVNGVAAVGTVKIAVKVWRPLLDKLEERLEQACIRRDAYLARLLANEVPLLDEEVPAPNSPTAQAYIAQHLDALERKQVTLTLPAVLCAQLKDVCERKGISRDSFFNRVFLLLVGRRELVDRLLFVDWPKWRTYVWEECKHDGPFFDGVFEPLVAPADPFWPMREALKEQAKDDPVGSRLYTVYFPQIGAQLDLVGMNTWVDDALVPGTDAHTAQRKHFDELMADL